MSKRLDNAATKVGSVIDQRAQAKQEANRVEASYAASTRQHHARRREANRLEWIEHHKHMYRSHSRLASYHAAEAVALEDGKIERS